MATIVLNGRVSGEDAEMLVNRLFQEWNAILGWEEFGF